MERRDLAEFIGYVGLWDVPAEVHFAPAREIGYRLARSQWKHGFATEAARAVRDAAFEPFGLTNVLSFTAVVNAPSRAVMERIGLQQIVCAPVTTARDVARRHVRRMIR